MKIILTYISLYTYPIRIEQVRTKQKYELNCYNMFINKNIHGTNRDELYYMHDKL